MSQKTRKSAKQPVTLTQTPFFRKQAFNYFSHGIIQAYLIIQQ
ncbi:MAG: hypothetical protein ACRC62_01415 [Microcoleus sp.]